MTIKENRERCIIEEENGIYTVNKAFWQIYGKRVGCKVNNKAFAWAVVIDIDYKDKPNRSEWIKQNILPVLEERVRDFDYKVVPSRNGGYHLWIPIYPLSIDLVNYFVKRIVKGLDRKSIDVYPSGRSIFLPEENFDVSLEKNTKILLTKIPPKVRLKAKFPLCIGFALHPHFYRNGTRHDFCLGVAGVCRKYMGLSEEMSMKYVEKIVEWHNDEEMKDRLTAVRTTFEKESLDDVGACKIITDHVISNTFCSFCKYNQLPDLVVPTIKLQEDNERVSVELLKEFFIEEPFKYLVELDRNNPHIPLGIFFTFMSGVLKDYKFKLPLGSEGKFNLYSIVVRPTGTGKSLLTKTIKEAIQEALYEFKLQGISWTTASPVSEMGLVKNGLSNGSAFTIFYDEFRKLLRFAKSDSEWVSSLMDIYLEAYNYHKEHHIWTAKNEIVLQDVALSMLGLTTPEALKEMGSQYLNDGFLNRFLILYSSKNPKRSRKDVYSFLVKWLKTFFAVEISRTDKFIKFNPAVDEYLDELHWKLNNLIEESYNAFAPLYRRIVEMVRRLSALISVIRSTDTGSVEVGYDDLELALNFIRYCLVYHQNMSIIGGRDSKGKKQLQILNVMREEGTPLTIKDIEFRLLEKYATSPNPKMIYDTLNALKKASYVRQEGDYWRLTDLGKIDTSYSNLFVKNVINLLAIGGGKYDERVGKGIEKFDGGDNESNSCMEGDKRTGEGNSSENDTSNDADRPARVFDEGGVMVFDLGIELKDGVIVLDIETYSDDKETLIGVSQREAVNPRYAKVRLIQIGMKNKVYVCDMFKVSWSEVEKILDNAKVIVGHNIGFDLAVLKQNYGWEGYRDKFLYDTMIATQLFKAAKEGDINKVSLKDVVDYWLGEDISKEMQTSYWGIEKLNEEQVRYAVNDIRYTAKVYKETRELMATAFLNVFKIEMNFLRDVMVDLNLQRLRVNKNLQKVVDKLEKEFNVLVKEFKKDYPVLWSSALQVDKWLKEHIPNYNQVAQEFDGEVEVWENSNLGLMNKEVDSKVRTGKEFLLFLQYKDGIPHEVKEFCKRLLRIRQLNKHIEILRDKFLSKEFVEPKFRQIEHGVGRIAVRNPNTQNIPREYKSKWMQPSSKDRAIVKCDWGKLHLIIVASLAGEKNIKEWEEKGEDIHRKLAALIYNIPEEQVTKEQRQVAKGVAYALLYGSGERTLVKQLIKGGILISLKEAKKFIDAFYKLYPRIKEWHKKMKREYYQNKDDQGSCIVRTVGGRLILARDVPEYMNFKVQGTEADLMKMSAFTLNRLLREGGMNARIINIVHDELVVECDVRDVEKVRQLVEDIMVGVGKRLLNNYPVTAESEVVYWSDDNE